MLRKVICVLIVFLYSISVKAQVQKYHTLRGRVLNNNGEIIVGAVLSCIELPDSAIVSYCVTNTEGLFQIKELTKSYNQYILEASCLGYEKLCVNPKSEEINITLKETAIELEEITVTASAPGLKQKAGKLIYTPRFSEIEGIDSYDMLRYTPLLTVTNNSVSILGKGTSTIHINGRKPLMDNTSLMEMLRSIPASQIEHVEINMTPNSSQKASTIGGIVNIIMKKNPNQGLIGNVNVSGTYLGKKTSPRTSVYLGYSKNKFNASTNLSYQNYVAQNQTDATYNYKESASTIQNLTTQQTTGHFLNGNINMSYDFTQGSTMGVSFHIGGSEIKANSTTNSCYQHHDTIHKHTISINETTTPFKKPEISAVAYYNLKTDKKGSNLDITANYSSSKKVSLENMQFAKDKDKNALFQQNSTVESYGYEFKGNYSHYFDEDNYIKTGYEFNTSHLSNDFIHNDIEEDQFVKNEDLSNYYIYDEKINAIYITHDRLWGKRLSTTLGIRAENTNVKGNQLTSNEQFSRKYWNFFPNLSVLVDLSNGDYSIALDLARSILRPFYNDLNPFKIWTSENTFTAGNIHIKPMIYNEANINFSFLSDYIIGAYYTYSSDAFSEYTFLAENKTTVSSVANYGHEQELSLYFNMDKILFKGIWRISVNASADYEQTDGNIGDHDVGYKNWTGSAGIRNIIKISPKHGLQATINYHYYTPSRGIMKIGQHKHLLNVSLKKEFKFGGTFNIDMLNLLNYKPSYHYHTAIYSFNNTPITNNISIQIRYTQKFGQNRVRGAQNRSDTYHLGRFKK